MMLKEAKKFFGEEMEGRVVGTNPCFFCEEGPTKLGLISTET